MSDTTAPSFVSVAPLWALAAVKGAGFLYSEVHDFKITDKTITFSSWAGTDKPGVRLFRRNAWK